MKTTVKTTFALKTDNSTVATWLVEEFTQNYTGVEVRLQTNPPDLGISVELSIELEAPGTVEMDQGLFSQFIKGMAEDIAFACAAGAINEGEHE